MTTDNFKVKVEPQGSRLFGYNAYNITVYVPYPHRYAAENDYAVWAKNPQSKRIIREATRLAKRLQKRLAMGRIDKALRELSVSPEKGNGVNAANVVGGMYP